jgi:type I restriction-modification system DNA methylase subunit
MGLFQKTVFNNFVNNFAMHTRQELSDAYQRFQIYFQTPSVQAKILVAKEELYQRTFVRDFFETVLGYIHHPKPNHNLEIEKKNEDDSRKADAALLKNGIVTVVIELKSAKTHLDTVVEQAFSYFDAHKKAKCVITSNFTHLRFYLDNDKNYEEFDLFNLTYQEFEKMYALLCPATLLTHAIDKLKEDSDEEYKNITKEFYDKYEAFKSALCLNIGINNKDLDKLLIFQNAQKILDRIIFMYFASGRGLLPANHVKVVTDEQSELVKMNIGGTLYDRFKAHFEFINSGFSSEKYQIYAYNGGLFAKDAVLDKLKIDDHVLQYHCGQLLKYDFVSDIDVNILGHIFEHSLNQAHEKKQEILQQLQDLEAGKEIKNQSQRKTDGIFYTPIYITNYMIEETLGKFCADKKAELGLNKSAEIINLPALKKYKKWLDTVSVLDPACGSGAFLNQVLSFFIREYSWIENLY